MAITQKTYNTWRDNPTGLIPKGEFCDHCCRFNARQSVVDVIVMNEKNEILMILRTKDPAKGMWCLPSGYVEWDETLVQAAMRELKEETGLTADSIEFFDLFDDLDRDPDGRQNIAHCFIAKTSGSTNTESDEVKDIRWFSANALPKEVAFDHRKMIERYLQHDR